jgi:two-component system, OmpR family, response regulator
MPPRILIVDDEPNVLKGWARALRLEGYRVSTASTPQEALDLADEHRFDVTVLDFLMPLMTGIELLTRLRKKIPTIRSVVISGRIDKKLTAEQLTSKLRDAVEADVYLHKPVSNNELADTVAQLLTSETSTWKDFAKQAASARTSKIKTAKETAKELKKDLKKKA